jgi:hypothetical protein
MPCGHKVPLSIVSMDRRQLRSRGSKCYAAADFARSAPCCWSYLLSRCAVVTVLRPSSLPAGSARPYHRLTAEDGAASAEDAWQRPVTAAVVHTGNGERRADERAG